jgi:hypothetical protein
MTPRVAATKADSLPRAPNNARACSLGDQCDARRKPSSSKIDGSTSGRTRMEPYL